MYVYDLANASTILFPIIFADGTNPFVNGKDLGALIVTILLYYTSPHLSSSIISNTATLTTNDKYLQFYLKSGPVLFAIVEYIVYCS